MAKDILREAEITDHYKFILSLALSGNLLWNEANIQDNELW